MIRFNRQNNKGFTLIETLVAVSIFSVSILGLMSVLSSGISNTTYAKQKIIASYLAQEGIEYIRNMRDTYVLYGANGQAGWNAFNTKLSTNSCLATGNGCYFNADGLNYLDKTQPMNDLAFSPCVGSGGACPEMKYDSATGKYNYSTGSNTGFFRKIKVIQDQPNETKISSTVSWMQGSGNHSVTFSENLFNWVN